MTVALKTLAGVPRIVDASTGHILKSKHGKAADGGRANASGRGVVIARRQALHINQAQEARKHG